jgi:hypothetical protein
MERLNIGRMAQCHQFASKLYAEVLFVLCKVPPVLTKLNSETMHSQAMEIVPNGHEFMKREAELGLQMPLTKFGKRTQAATGVSEKTVRNKKQYGILFRKGETEIRRNIRDNFQLQGRHGTRHHRKHNSMTSTKVLPAELCKTLHLLKAKHLV